MSNATTIKKTFSRQTGVSIEIDATPSTIWQLLTDGAGFPRWNTTVLAITGQIAPGEKIVLQSTLNPKRSFKLKVKAWEPEKRLVWGDAMGNREYTLSAAGNGRTLFTMVEKIGGPLFPLFARMIPPFDAAFDQFANDLKKAAEAAAGNN